MVAAVKMKINADASQAKKELKTLGIRTRELTDREKKFGVALMAVGAATAYAMKQAINYGDELGKTADRVGVGVEALAGLQHGAELSGASADDLNAALKGLGKVMYESAKDPAADTSKTFRKLGVDIKDAGGNLRDTDDVFRDIGDAFSNMSNGAEKSAIAMKLMEESGSLLIPLLNEGSAGLDAMAQEARELGIVWSEEDTAAAAEFNDALKRLKTTFDGFVSTAVKAYLPVFVDIANGAVLAARAIFKLDLEERRRAANITGSQDVLNAYADKTWAYQRILEGVASAEERMATRIWTDALTRDMQIVAAAGVELGLFKNSTEEVQAARDALGGQLLSKQLQQETGYSVTWREENEKNIRILFRELQVREGIDDILAVRKQRYKEIRREMAGEAGIMVATGAEMQEILREREIEEGKVSDAVETTTKTLTDQEKALLRLMGTMDAYAQATASIVRQNHLMGKSGEDLIAARTGQAMAAAMAERDAMLAQAEGNQAQIDQITAAWEARRDVLSEKYAAEIALHREAEEAKTQITEEESEKRVLTEEEQTVALQGAMMQNLESFSSFADSTASIVASVYGEGSKEAEEAQKVAFFVNKAVALASAVVNTAQAITNALAVQPYPVGAALAVSAGIAGGAQIAAITAATISGLADAGLPPGALRAAGLNNHSLIAMRNDEMVLDPVGTRAISEMLQAKSSGMTDSRPVEVTTTLELDGEVLGRSVDSHLVRSAERGNAYGSRIRYGDR